MVEDFLKGDDWDALAVELEEVDGGNGWYHGIDVGGLVGADELGEAEVGAQGEEAQSLEVIDKEINRVAVLSRLKNGTLFFVADLAERLGSGKDELMLLAKIGCLYLIESFLSSIISTII